MRTLESNARGLKDWLDALPEAPRKADREEARQAADQRRRMLETLRESLRQLIDERGYSTREVVALLKQKGVEVAVSTLHAHVRKARAARVPAAPVAEAIRPRPRRAARLARPAPPDTPVLESAIETSAVSSRHPVEVPPTDAARSDAGAFAAPAPGTFVPRPERPIDWYRPSSRNGNLNGASDD